MYLTVNQATKIVALQFLIPNADCATNLTTAAVGEGVVNVRLMQQTIIFYSIVIDRLQSRRLFKVCYVCRKSSSVFIRSSTAINDPTCASCVTKKRKRVWFTIISVQKHSPFAIHKSI